VPEIRSTHHTKDTTSSGRVDGSGEVTGGKQPEGDFEETEESDKGDGRSERGDEEDEGDERP